MTNIRPENLKSQVPVRIGISDLNRLPCLVPPWPGPACSARAGCSIRSNLAAVDSATNPVVNWNWYFGDGSTSAAQDPSHTYAAFGHFTALVVETNSQGVPVAGEAKTITVTPVRCIWGWSKTAGLKRAISRDEICCADTGTNSVLKFGFLDLSQTQFGNDVGMTVIIAVVQKSHLALLAKGDSLLQHQGEGKRDQSCVEGCGQTACDALERAANQLEVASRLECKSESANGQTQSQHRADETKHRNTPNQSIDDHIAGRNPVFVVLRLRAYLSSAARDYLYPALAKFRKEHPATRLRLLDLSPGEMLNSLRQGELDVAITYIGAAIPSVDFYVRKLKTVACVAVLPQSHPFASRRQLKLSELKGATFVTSLEADMPGYNQRVARLCRKVGGFKAKFIGQPQSLAEGLDLVANDDVVVLLPNFSTNPSRPGVNFVPISDPQVSWDLFLAWKRGPAGRSLRALLDALSAVPIIGT
jgi:DNA-binding transcriptional LysR family regulator